MIVALLLLFLSQVQSEYGIHKKCITPHGYIATCIEVTSCYHLYEVLVSKPNNTAVKKYLKQSYCGMRKGIHLVCCGSPVNIFEECGIVENVGHRIFGGKTVEDHFPWMAAIQYKEEGQHPEFRCAGFLINSQFVMTAAHCLRAQPIHSVHLGISNLTNYSDQKTHLKVEVINVTYHENFRSTLDDIGLIRIKPVKYSDNVRWICLPKKNAEIPKQFTTRGWGRNNKMIRTFTIALENRLKVTPYDDCPLASRRNLPQSRIFCAGGEENIDTCEGDSGGALINKVDDSWTAYGIVSWGSRDCSRGDPAIYTKIQYYTDWLEKSMLTLLSFNKT